MYKFSALGIIVFFSIIFSKDTFARRIMQTVVTVEPANWWADMELDTVSFLVYCKNGIKSIDEVSKNAQKISIRNINENYAIVTCKINSEGSIRIFGIDNRGSAFNKMIPILKNKKEYTPKGFSTSDLVYLIMPDRFANGNPNNDDVAGMEKSNRVAPDGRHGGDLQGIIKHLDYIKQLGVTAIWTTPFQEMNDQQGSYHGYGMSNLYATDARYASGDRLNTTNNNEIFKQYTEACHNSNIKVIMDVVPNHIGIAHPWVNGKTALWDWIHDSTQSCNFEMTTINDPYSTEKDRQSMENGWFVKSMPDLNHQNKDLCNYIIQSHIWWVKSMNIDALRIDTQPFNDRKFISDWARALKKEFPSINLVGENWCVINTPSYPAYYQSGSHNKDGYDSKVESIMDFPVFESLINSLKNNDMKILYRTLGQDFIYSNPNKNFVFFGNHDTERFYTSIKEDYAKYKIGVILNATLRGIPQLYYGDELLMTGPKGINDGLMRKDMPGGWDGDSINVFDSPEKILSYQFTSKVFNWRKNNEVIHLGTFKHSLPKNNIYAYTRTYKNKAVLIVINMGDQDFTYNINDYNSLLTQKYSKANIENFDTNNENLTHAQKIKANGFMVVSLSN
jgi:neopullulanase